MILALSAGVAINTTAFALSGRVAIIAQRAKTATMAVCTKRQNCDHCTISAGVMILALSAGVAICVFAESAKMATILH